MDAVLTAALGSLPQLGGAGLLAFFVILLIRREGTALERERTAYAAELTRIQTAHTKEMEDRDETITALRARCRELDAEVDEERTRRRAAEDVATGRDGRSPWAG